MDLVGLQPRTDLATRPETLGADPARSERSMFAGLLARAKTELGTPEARAREGAEQLVATALVLPVLKGLRESNGAAAPFAPSSGEKSFRAIADGALAERLVRRSDWALVDRIADTMLRRGAAGTGIAPGAGGAGVATGGAA
ncbi:MAG: hypothetical protein SFY69_00315 [Planctomycetota bacterium]|nr:hypothetical protein [Planctomycetota bacterium]